MRSRRSDALLELKDTHANGVTEEAMYRQLRMAAGDIFRRGPDCLPMGTEIPLRFISERKARLFLQVPQKNRCRVTDYWIPQNHGDLAVKFF
ncbi:rCG48980, isoform CRA_a [Rattus norvegicus]|uniref:RCG48980, isoform CRA_a n=1 Tax=Rattus norvegicus TaxID=10116 RepID=A6IFW3_RAT|nr:rCG48980, isoform CRA_a [Rattus norvegicus]